MAPTGRKGFMKAQKFHMFHYVNEFVFDRAITLAQFQKRMEDWLEDVARVTSNTLVAGESGGGSDWTEVVADSVVKTKKK
jgi:hypothetical protein